MRAEGVQAPTCVTRRGLPLLAAARQFAAVHVASRTRLRNQPDRVALARQGPGGNAIEVLSSALMARYRQAFLFALFLGVASFVQPQPHAQIQTDVTGEWEASYQTPLGPQELKIYLTQEGLRISGHTTSEYGESQVRGTINGQDVQFTFQSTDGGRAIDVRVTAKVEGERMRGTAKIGDRAEGAFTAERTAS
jgi:hypothetical protein